MYQQKKILAIIPARGGSKGIINKNIKEVCGKRLISYTIEAAKASQYIDRIYVSTDSERIAEICQEHGISVKEFRPKELATDHSAIIDTVRYTLNLLEKEMYDYVVLLQPTQPLRQAKHIDEAIELLVVDKRESIVSVTEVEEHPIFMRTIDEKGILRSILQLNSTVRRQDLSTVYRVNGAIYINKVADILTNNVSFNDNKFPYVMDKQFDLDIDTESDLEKFKQILEMGRS